MCVCGGGGGGYRRRLRSLLLYLCDVFRELINAGKTSHKHNSKDLSRLR